MRALRFIYVLALVVWLGGLLTAGAVVAPVIFRVLQAQDPVAGRAAAGEVFGAVLAQLHIVGYASGSVMFVVLTVLRLLGPRPIAYGIRAGLLAVMLLVTAYADRVVLTRAQALQRETGRLGALAPTDVRRQSFDHLHQESTWLVGLVVAGGLALAGWETRE